MVVRCDMIRSVLRGALDAIRDNRRGELIRKIGGLTQLMGLQYDTPGRTDYRGDRVADPGAGEVLMTVRQLRDSIDALPTDVGLGGVVFDGDWMLGMLDQLITLLER